MIKKTFLFLLVVAVNTVHGQITSNNTTTNWATGTGWSGGSVPDLVFWSGANDTEVSHNKTKTGNLQIDDNNTLTIKSPAVVTITGDLELGNNGKVYIEDGATLTIDGKLKGISNVKTGGGSTMQVDDGGTLNIGLSASIGNTGTNYTWNGDVNITGALTVDGTTDITMNHANATLDVGGALTVTSDGGLFVTQGAVDITGDLTATGANTDIALSGTSTMTIGGNASTTSDADLVINTGSSIDITGNYSMSGALSTTVVDGNLTIGGNLSMLMDSQITGDAVLTWGGTLSMTGGCGSGNYIQCDGTGTKLDDHADACYDDLPAGKSINLTTCAAACPTATVGGSVAAAATVCSASNGATLTLSGHTGTINNWQKNENGGGWTDVANATTTLVYSNISVTTQYRAQVQNGASCDEENSADVTITVNPSPTADAGGALAAICQSATSAAMGGSVGGGATGGTWSGGAGTWTNASDPANATYTAGAAESGAITLTLTTSGGSCGTTTDTKNITVNVNPTADAGGALAAICQSATSAAMGGSVGGSATGGTWSGGAGTWTNASNPATATYTAGAAESGSITLTLTTSGGSCGAVTDTKNITVNANPTADAGAALADLCQNATTVAMGGSVGGGATGGTWSGGGGTWTNATNPATATYTAGGVETGAITLTLTTSGGSCGVATDTKDVTVDALAVGGTITAAASGCYGDNGATLTLAGHSGTITRWESSTDNWTTPNDIGNGGSTTYAYSNLTATTKYRVVMTNGACSENSADVTITVYDDLTSGTIGTAQSISHGGTPSTLTETVAAVGGDGVYTYQWESSTNDGASWANAGGTDDEATYSPGALTLTTWYRRTITSGSGCGSETSNTVIVTVNMYVCSGSSPSNISSGGAAEYVGGGGTPTYAWESSTDNVTYNAIVPAETAATLSSVASITANTWYRRKVTIDGCVAYSNALKATISGGSPGGISSGLVVWLKADAGTGSINTQWDDQSGNGYHYTTVGTPVVSAGDSSSNYNAFIELTNAEGFNAPAGSALGSDHTIFVVARKTSTDNDGRILDGQTANNYAWGHDGTYGMSLINATSPSKGQSSPATTASAEVKMLQTFKRTSAGAYTHRVDGASTASYGSSDDPAGDFVDINAGASGLTSSCRVFEVVIYNSALSTSDIEIVESYLMTKYGLGTNNNAYKTSAGGTTYDVASYNNDIIGIGKECYFNQKQSGTDDDSVRVWVSNGAWAATNSAHSGSIANDASYVMVGHDNGLLRATAAANAEKPAGINNRIEREWKVTNTNFDEDFTIEIEWDSAGAFDLADIRLLVDDDGDFSDATVYADGDQGMSFTIGSIKFNNVPVAVVPKGGTKFIAIGAVGATTLPVELMKFDVTQEDGYNLISWTTGSEINSSHFVVEKSVDGINWEILQVVQAAGSSMEKINYEVIDDELCAKKCYYRLNQVDEDGSNDYSDIKVIENSDVARSELSIYPVPVVESAAVDFKAPYTAMYSVEIMSLTGSVVYEAKVVCVAGDNSFNINTSSYAPGMYYLIIRDAEGEIMDKVNFAK